MVTSLRSRCYKSQDNDQKSLSLLFWFSMVSFFYLLEGNSAVSCTLRILFSKLIDVKTQTFCTWKRQQKAAQLPSLQLQAITCQHSIAEPASPALVPWGWLLPIAVSVTDNDFEQWNNNNNNNNIIDKYFSFLSSAKAVKHRLCPYSFHYQNQKNENT